MAKRQALELGVTVSEVVNRGLRRALVEPPAVPRKYETLTYGDAQAPPSAWGDLRRRDDDDDIEWLSRKNALIADTSAATEQAFAGSCEPKPRNGGAHQT